MQDAPADQQPPQAGQADPPGRVIYISALEGTAQLATADTGELTPATLNWPLTTGMHLTVALGARTELHGGTKVLRLLGPANLDVTLLDDTNTQVALTEGSLSLRVRELQPDERIEIDTPQLALVATQPGEYRVDVDPASNTTRVTVHMGAATVYGETGQSATCPERQQTTYSGRALTAGQRVTVTARDALDQWAAQRDALEEKSVSAQYVSRAVPGYQLLDNNGQWAQDQTYGAVWYPTVSDPEWAPYRYGRWSWVEPWGWTWVDDAPWGFAPAHYGRWTQIGLRWAWVPGPIATPLYAPAVVGFVGGDGFGVAVDTGLPAVAWFPIGPGEYWQPSYRVSSHYLSRVNTWHGRPVMRPASGSYRFQRHPGAISGSFGGGRSGRFASGSRLPSGALNQSRLMSPASRGARGPMNAGMGSRPANRPSMVSAPGSRGAGMGGGMQNRPNFGNNRQGANMGGGGMQNRPNFGNNRQGAGMGGNNMQNRSSLGNRPGNGMGNNMQNRPNFGNNRQGASMGGSTLQNRSSLGNRPSNGMGNNMQNRPNFNNNNRQGASMGGSTLQNRSSLGNRPGNGMGNNMQNRPNFNNNRSNGNMGSGSTLQNRSSMGSRPNMGNTTQSRPTLNNNRSSGNVGSTMQNRSSMGSRPSMGNTTQSRPTFNNNRSSGSMNVQSRPTINNSSRPAAGGGGGSSSGRSNHRSH